MPLQRFPKQEVKVTAFKIRGEKVNKMVMQNILQEKAQSLNEIEGEISLLTTIGVDDQEIKYLIYLKNQRMWND